VAKLEPLLASIDIYQQRLAKIPTVLKRFRQAVLAAACSGRLTANWRAERLDQQAYVESYINGAHSRIKVYEISSFDDLPILPESWSYEPIGNLSDFQQGMQIAKKPDSRNQPITDFRFYAFSIMRMDLEKMLNMQIPTNKRLLLMLMM
jgi:type I restriction enzyme S subunit